MNNFAIRSCSCFIRAALSIDEASEAAAGTSLPLSESWTTTEGELLSLSPGMPGSILTRTADVEPLAPGILRKISSQCRIRGTLSLIGNCLVCDRKLYGRDFRPKLLRPKCYGIISLSVARATSSSFQKVRF